MLSLARLATFTAELEEAAVVTAAHVEDAWLLDSSAGRSAGTDIVVRRADEELPLRRRRLAILSDDGASGEEASPSAVARSLVTLGWAVLVVAGACYVPSLADDVNATFLRHMKGPASVEPSAPISGAGPLLTVRLSYASGDHGAEERARALALSLRAAGDDASEQVASHLGTGHSGVRYFFVEDSHLANALADRLGTTATLVAAAPDHGLARPGLVLVDLSGASSLAASPSSGPR